MGSNYRTQFYYAGGAIVPVQDKDRGSPTIQFTKANTKQEVGESGKVVTPNFSYSSSQLAVRHTQIVCRFADKK